MFFKRVAGRFFCERWYSIIGGDIFHDWRFSTDSRLYDELFLDYIILIVFTLDYIPIPQLHEDITSMDDVKVV